MKNKIAKILGAVLTVVTLASLFVFAGPVSAAAPDQSWNTLSNPGNTGLVMPTPQTGSGAVPITYTGPVIRATAPDSNGNYDLFAYIEQGTTLSIIRSSNFGRTWTVIATPAGRVACMVSAATDANTLYYAINTPAETVYKSSNALAASVTWVPEVNAPLGAGQIVSINAMLFGGRYLVAIGTNNVGGAANVYWMDESIPFFSFATLGTSDFATAVGGGVTSVIAVYFSPNFTADRALFAVGAKAASTVLAVNVAGGDWTGAMGTASLPNTSSIAQIFFPSDYNFATFPRFFVAVNGASTALYWFIGGATSALVAIPPTGIPGITGQIDSLDGNGAFATANLMVGTTTGQVFISANGGATWNVPTKAPTGTGACLVIMKSDFATSHAALAFKLPTTGANDESGVSITQDSGLTYNQISLLNSSITNIYSLALGTAYTFAAGSNSSTSTAISFAAGGYVTFAPGIVPADSFKITASNSGDQIVFTRTVATPTAQQITVPGLNVDVGAVLSGPTTTTVGNTFFLNSVGDAVTLTALHNGVLQSVTVNGSGIPNVPFADISIAIGYDPNANAHFSTATNSLNDTGTVNYNLPNSTADTATITPGTGTFSTQITNTSAALTTFATNLATFASVGDSVLFTATSDATTGTWARGVGAATAAIVTDFNANASVVATGGAYNLPNGVVVYSQLTLAGAGLPSATLSGSGYWNDTTTTPGSDIITFTSSSGSLTVQNNNTSGPISFTANNTNVVSTAPSIVVVGGRPAAILSGQSGASGTYPGTINLVAQINAVPAVTTYTNFVWRYELATGNWERVQFAAGQTAAQNIINLSATGNALFATSSGTSVVKRSLDNGQNWAPMIFVTPGPIYSIVAVDPLTVIAGGSGAVYKSLANGFWSTIAVALGNIGSLAVNPSNNAYIVAAGTTGQFDISSDAGSTFGTPAPSTPIAAFVGFPMKVSFSASGTANNTVYSTATGAVGVYLGPNRVDNNAAALDSSSNAQVASSAGVGYGIASGTGNTVAYALDATDGIVARITNASGTTYTAGGLASGGSSAQGLWVQAAAGKNSLWGIFAGNTIKNYIDYLAVSVTGVTVPAATITPTSAVVSWTAVTAGTSSGIQYQASITTGSTALTNPYTSLPLAGTQTGLTTTSATFTGLANFTQYTVSVWVVAPVVSFYGSATFTTQLAAPVGIAPVAPANQTVPIVPSFSWTSVPGATGYTLWISQSDPTFATKTVLTVAVSGNPVSALNWTGTPLANNTTYYWEVQATAGTAVGPFSSIYGFTTVVAQLPAVTVTQSTTTLTATSVPVPTIIVNLPPVVTVTQNAPAPTPVLTVTQPTYTIAAQETTTPTYIWIIVGIGALLTLAVIILIIRTRRVV